MNITFNTKEELLQQLKKDMACAEGFKWAKEQKTLDDIFNECEHAWRVWALMKGYVQFADKCDWESIASWPLACLLREQPQFADRCDWENPKKRLTLSGYGWARLLSKQPQFADRCDWGKLDGVEWDCLLRVQPQFKKYK